MFTGTDHQPNHQPSPTEPDGLYDKYRVFKEPEFDEGMGHPIPLFGPYAVPPAIDPGNYIEAESISIGFKTPLEEVHDFVFVLKPNSDRHARVAMAAYAWSCMEDLPGLSEDLLRLLNQEDWNGS